MFQQTTPRERRMFFSRHREGQTYEQIAEMYGRSPECVRYWCRRQRDGGSCVTQYKRTTPGLLSHFKTIVRYVILRLRLEHPRWGPHSILLHLQKRPSLLGQRLPSPATIGRYIRQWPKLRRPRWHQGQRRQQPKPPERVHQRWQLDFKMRVPLDDGTKVHLFTSCDPIAGACTGASFFVASGLKRIKMENVRAFLRSCFARWETLPEEIQTDGEPALVGQSNKDAFPSRFTLWLKGLGIDHLVTRSRHATDNAEVERMHRTLNEYTIQGNEKLSVSELQQRLEQGLEERLWELPSWAKECHGRPPATVYPELFQRPRPFQADHELAHFDLDRVDAFLATCSWRRRVNKCGQVTIGQKRRYSVGRQYAGKDVLVRFDPSERHFVFYDMAVPDKELVRRRVRGLQITDLTGVDEWPFGQGLQQLSLPLKFFQGVSC